MLSTCVCYNSERIGGSIVLSPNTGLTIKSAPYILVGSVCLQGTMTVYLIAKSRQDMVPPQRAKEAKRLRRYLNM